MGGEKWHMAVRDNTLEMFDYKEEHKNIMAGGHGCGVSGNVGNFSDRGY